MNNEYGVWPIEQAEWQQGRWSGSAHDRPGRGHRCLTVSLVQKVLLVAQSALEGCQMIPSE